MRIIKDLPSYHRDDKFIDKETPIGQIITKLINSIDNEQELLSNLKEFKYWNFPKVSLWMFEVILNKLDELLSKYKQDIETNKEPLQIIFSFYKILLDNTVGKYIFASFDHLQDIFFASRTISLKVEILDIYLCMSEIRKSLHNFYVDFLDLGSFLVDLREFLVNILLQKDYSSSAENDALVLGLEKILLGIHKEWKNSSNNKPMTLSIGSGMEKPPSKAKAIPVNTNTSIALMENSPMRLFKYITDKNQYHSYTMIPKLGNSIPPEILKDYQYFSSFNDQSSSSLSKEEIKYRMQIDHLFIIISELFQPYESNLPQKSFNDILTFNLVLLNMYTIRTIKGRQKLIIMTEYYIERYLKDVLLIITSVNTLEIKSIALLACINFIKNFTGYESILFQNGLFHSIISDLTHQNNINCEVMTYEDSINQDFFNSILVFLHKSRSFKEIPIHFLNKVLEVPKNNVYPYRIDNVKYAIKKIKNLDEGTIKELIVPRIIYELNNIFTPDSEINYLQGTTEQHPPTVFQRTILISKLMKMLMSTYEKNKNIIQLRPFEDTLTQAIISVITNEKIYQSRLYDNVFLNCTEFFVKICFLVPNKIPTFLSTGKIDSFFKFFMKKIPKMDGSLNVLFQLINALALHEEGKQYLLKNNHALLNEVFEFLFSAIAGEHYLHYTLLIITETYEDDIFSPYISFIKQEGLQKIHKSFFEQLDKYIDVIKAKINNMKLPTEYTSIEVNDVSYKVAKHMQLLLHFFIHMSLFDCNTLMTTSKIDLKNLIDKVELMLYHPLVIYSLSLSIPSTSVIVKLFTDQPQEYAEKIYENFNIAMEKIEESTMTPIQKTKAILNLFKFVKEILKKIIPLLNDKSILSKILIKLMHFINTLAQQQANIRVYMAPVNDFALVIQGKHYYKFISNKTHSSLRDLILKNTKDIVTTMLPTLINPEITILNEDNFTSLFYEVDFSSYFRVEFINGSNTFSTEELIDPETKLLHEINPLLSFISNIGRNLKIQGLKEIKEPEIASITTWMDLSYVLFNLLKTTRENNQNPSSSKSQTEIIILYMNTLNNISLISRKKHFSSVVIYYFIKYGGIREIFLIIKHLQIITENMKTEKKALLVDLLLMKNIWNVILITMMNLMNYEFENEQGYYLILLKEDISEFNLKMELSAYVKHMILNDFIEVFCDGKDNLSEMSLKDISNDNCQFHSLIFNIVDVSVTLFKSLSEMKVSTEYVKVKELELMGFVKAEIILAIQELQNKGKKDDIVNYILAEEKQPSQDDEEMDDVDDESEIIQPDPNDPQQPQVELQVEVPPQQQQEIALEPQQEVQVEVQLQEPQIEAQPQVEPQPQLEPQPQVEEQQAIVPQEEPRANNNNENKPKRFDKIKAYLNQVINTPTKPSNEFISKFSNDKDNNAIDNLIITPRNKTHPYTKENFMSNLMIIYNLLTKDTVSKDKITQNRKMNIVYRIKELKKEIELIPYLRQILILEQENLIDITSSKTDQSTLNKILNNKMYINYIIFKDRSKFDNFFDSLEVDKMTAFLEEFKILETNLNSINYYCKMKTEDNDTIIKIIYECYHMIYIVISFITHFTPEKNDLPTVVLKKKYIETFITLLSNPSKFNENILILILTTLTQNFNKNLLDDFVIKGGFGKILQLKHNPKNSYETFLDTKFKTLVTFDEVLRLFILKLFIDDKSHQNLFEGIFRYLVAVNKEINEQNEILLDDFIKIIGEYVTIDMKDILIKSVREMFDVVEKQMKKKRRNRVIRINQDDDNDSDSLFDSDDNDSDDDEDEDDNAKKEEDKKKTDMAKEIMKFINPGNAEINIEMSGDDAKMGENAERKINKKEDDEMFKSIFDSPKQTKAMHKKYYLRIKAEHLPTVAMIRTELKMKEASNNNNNNPQQSNNNAEANQNTETQLPYQSPKQNKTNAPSSNILNSRKKTEDQMFKLQKIFSQNNITIINTLMKHIWRICSDMEKEIEKNQLNPQYSLERKYLANLDTTLISFANLIHAFPGLISIVFRYHKQKQKISFLTFLIKNVFYILSYYSNCTLVPEGIKSNNELLEKIAKERPEEIVKRIGTEPNSSQSVMEAYRYSNIISFIMQSFCYRRRNMTEDDIFLIQKSRKKIINEINQIISEIASKKNNDFNQFSMSPNASFPKSLIQFKACLQALFSLTEFHEDSHVYSQLNPFELSKIVFSKETDIVKNICVIMKGMALNSKAACYFHKMTTMYYSEIFKYLRINSKVKRDAVIMGRVEEEEEEENDLVMEMNDEHGGRLNIEFHLQPNDEGQNGDNGDDEGEDEDDEDDDSDEDDDDEEDMYLSLTLDDPENDEEDDEDDDDDENRRGGLLSNVHVPNEIGNNSDSSDNDSPNSDERTILHTIPASLLNFGPENDNPRLLNIIEGNNEDEGGDDDEEDEEDEEEEDEEDFRDDQDNFSDRSRNIQNNDIHLRINNDPNAFLNEENSFNSESEMDEGNLNELNHNHPRGFNINNYRILPGQFNQSNLVLNNQGIPIRNLWNLENRNDEVLFYNPYLELGNNSSEQKYYYEDSLTFPFVICLRNKDDLLEFYHSNVVVSLLNRLGRNFVDKCSQIFQSRFINPFDIKSKRNLIMVLNGAKDKVINAYGKEINKMTEPFNYHISDYTFVENKQDIQKAIREELTREGYTVKDKPVKEKEKKISNKTVEKKEESISKKEEDVKEEKIKIDEELLEQIPEELREDVIESIEEHNNLPSNENNEIVHNEVGEPDNEDNKQDIRHTPSKQSNKAQKGSPVKIRNIGESVQDQSNIIQLNTNVDINPNPNVEPIINPNAEPNPNPNIIEENIGFDTQFIDGLPQDLREDVLLNLDLSIVNHLSPALREEYNRLVGFNPYFFFPNQVDLPNPRNILQIHNHNHPHLLNINNNPVERPKKNRHSTFKLEKLKFKIEDVLNQQKHSKEHSMYIINLFDDDFIENLLLFNIKYICESQPKYRLHNNQYWSLSHYLIQNAQLRHKIFDLLFVFWICDSMCLKKLLKSHNGSHDLLRQNPLLHSLYEIFVEEALPEDFYLDNYDQFLQTFCINYQKEMKKLFLETSYNNKGEFIQMNNKKKYQMSKNSYSLKQMLGIHYEEKENVLSNLLSFMLLKSETEIKKIFALKILTNMIQKCFNVTAGKTMKNSLHLSKMTIEKIVDLYYNFETLLELSKGSVSNNPTNLLCEMIVDPNFFRELLVVLQKHIEDLNVKVGIEMECFFKTKKIDINMFNKPLPENVLFKFVKLVNHIHEAIQKKYSDESAPIKDEESQESDSFDVPNPFPSNLMEIDESVSVENKEEVKPPVIEEKKEVVTLKSRYNKELNLSIKIINSTLFKCWENLDLLLFEISKLLKDDQKVIIPKLNRLIPHLEAFITLSHLQFLQENNSFIHSNPFIIEQAYRSSPRKTPMKLLYSPNGPYAGTFIEFFYKFCEKNKKVINLILRRYPKMFPNELLIKISQFLDLENKKNYFKRELKKLPINNDHLNVTIKRNFLFQDSFTQLNFKSPESLRGRLNIHFDGEEAVDAGGVKREWFTLLAKEMFNPNYMLFTLAKNGTTYTINSDSGKFNDSHLRQFEFIGRIIAKAIYDGVMIDCYFTRSFNKMINNTSLTYHDMQDYDQEFYNNLKWLLNNDITDIDVSLTYSYAHENLGQIEIIDLVENGRNIDVTEANKFDYVQKLCYAMLFDTIKPQIEAFLKGFYDIIPLKLIAIFDHRELELVISGLPTIDIVDLKKNTLYENYTEQSRIVTYFWEILEAFDDDECAEFLQFVTGSSKVPLEGFGALQGIGGINKFKISKVFETNYDRLPTAHTCTNQLDLPDYPSKEILYERLTLAIKEGKTGFGFI